MANLEYGKSRVMEPAGVLPPMAWKLDNSRELRKGEVRISLEKVILEWTGFQQICYSCSYADEQIRARILDIIEKRGKLQNPSTRSGGSLLGTVEKVSDQFSGPEDFRVGNRVYTVSTITAIPLHIESIESIDYDYGIVNCTGYAILFESTPVYIFHDDLEENLTLAAADLSGSLYGAHEVAVSNHVCTAMILGNNLHDLMIFASMMRETIGRECHISVVLDESYNDKIPRKEILKILKPVFQEVFFADFRQPLREYRRIERERKDKEPIDMVIVTDDAAGIETVGVALVRDGGCMYFSSFQNNYSLAVCSAECLGKVVYTYALDQYMKEEGGFMIRVLHAMHPNLQAVDALYKKYSGQKRISRSQANSIKLQNLGNDDGFVYKDLVTQSMVAEVMNIAKYDCSVIIQGETGSGKEKVLELLHQNSDRRTKPCIKINCATITETLAESEFFGYEAGAFTGAQAKGKVGYFELANDGILFLDEIGTLSLNMQSKLLRVLQENQFYRVGGTRPVNVNVRVICANNVPLRQLVDEGKFREDLYFRLNICTIDVPPLRERRDDIIALAEEIGRAHV